MKLTKRINPTVIVLVVAIAVFSIFLFVPLSAEAAGLVPCGGPGEPQCNLCFLAKLAQNVIEFAVQITFVLAALLFAYAGFLFFTGGADSGQITKAKKIFTNTLIGIIIVLTSWLMVDVLLKTLVGQGLTPFTQIFCEAPGTLNIGVKEGQSQDINSPESIISNQSFSEQCVNVKGAGWITVTDSFCIQRPEGDTRTYEWTTFSSGAKLCCALPSPSGDTTLSSSVFDISNTQGIQNFNNQCAAQGGYSTNKCLSSGYDPSTDTETCERAEFTCIGPSSSAPSPTVAVVSGETQLATGSFRIFTPEEVQTKVKDVKSYTSTNCVYAQQAGLSASDCSATLAVMALESGGNQTSEYKGSYGLMSVKVATAKQIDSSLANLSDTEVQNMLLANPDKNIELGNKYYSQLYQKYQDHALAAAAYNGGPGANDPSKDCPGLRRWQCLWDSPGCYGTNKTDCDVNEGYQETRAYVKNVAAIRAQLDKTQ